MFGKTIWLSIKSRPRHVSEHCETRMEFLGEMCFSLWLMLARTVLIFTFCSVGVTRFFTSIRMSTSAFWLSLGLPNRPKLHILSIFLDLWRSTTGNFPPHINMLSQLFFMSIHCGCCFRSKTSHSSLTSFLVPVVLVWRVLMSHCLSSCYWRFPHFAFDSFSDVKGA